MDAELIGTVGIEGRQLHVVRQQFAIGLNDHPNPTVVASGWSMRHDQALRLAQLLLLAVADR